jgi:hypothetical protein
MPHDRQLDLITGMEMGRNVAPEMHYLHLSYPRPGPLFSFSEMVDY